MFIKGVTVALIEERETKHMQVFFSVNTIDVFCKIIGDKSHSIGEKEDDTFQEILLFYLSLFVSRWMIDTRSINITPWFMQLV